LKLVALSAPDLPASELPLGRRSGGWSSRMPSLGEIEYMRQEEEELNDERLLTAGMRKI
jgi:hypothetical protein